MKLLMYGVSKETVMQEDVGKYQLTDEKKKMQMNDILSFEGVEEIVVLVNDFRNEYYLYVNEEIFSHGNFLRYLSEKTGKTLQEIILETYSKFNEDVLRHLYEVASGYLSKPLGDFDILESVEEALKYAVDLKTSGEILYKLFKEAIHLAYTLKLQDGMQPLNETHLAKYVYLLKNKMGTLEKKNYVLSGSDFEIEYLSKLLLHAGAQTVTIIHEDAIENERQINIVKKSLDENQANKIHGSNSKSLHYRLSKSDASILKISELSVLNEDTREEVSTIRQTKKIQYLIDTSEEPILEVVDDELDIEVIDKNTKITYNDEEKNNAVLVFDETLSMHIDNFMKHLEKLHNTNFREVTF